MSDVSNAATRKVWDLPVRMFHWLLVLSVVDEYLTNSAGTAISIRSTTWQ